MTRSLLFHKKNVPTKRAKQIFSSGTQANMVEKTLSLNQIMKDGHMRAVTLSEAKISLRDPIIHSHSDMSEELRRNMDKCQ